MTQTARTVRKRNFLRIVDYLRIFSGLGAALHGRQERHDLILVHHHRAHGIDDFKVFQLCLLVVQLLELSFDFGLFLFSLLDVGEDFLVLGMLCLPVLLH